MYAEKAVQMIVYLDLHLKLYTKISAKPHISKLLLDFLYIF